MEYKEKDVREHYFKARDIALELIEKKARNILKKHNELKEFVMSMGTYFFTNIKGNSLIDPEFDSGLKQFINRWDKELKLTNEPMRFTATGRKKTNW